MTPCEKLGHKAGDKFGVLRNTAFFGAGTIITLYHDDGSCHPYFYNEEIAALRDGDKYWPVRIGSVERINEGLNS